MKLKDYFKDALMLYLEKDKSPLKVRENWDNVFAVPYRDFANRKMNDLFQYEEGDLEKYPDSRMFLEEHCTGADLFRTLQDFKSKYGFFRKKNSKAQILTQKDIEERFPFKAIMRVFTIRHDLNQWRIHEESVKETLNRLKDIPEEDFLNELNKEED